MSHAVVPCPALRVSGCDWTVDWRGQTPGESLEGVSGVVQNKFPRFVGSVPAVLYGDSIGLWRSAILSAEGRSGAFRTPMIDPVSDYYNAGPTFDAGITFDQGITFAYRPVVRCVGAVAAGSTSIVIDESMSPGPVKPGFMSYKDWPFNVLTRRVRHGVVTLKVNMLRVDIPDGALIDMNAIGVFKAASDDAGSASYGLIQHSTPTLNLVEHLGRAKP